MDHRSLREPTGEKEEPDLLTSEILSTDLYEVLRSIASSYLHGGRRRGTLTPSDLVHEAWVKLGRDQDRHWKGVEHFRATAARAMRQILADRARSARARKGRVTLSSSLFDIPQPEIDLDALDRALRGLEAEHPRCARIVELRFFGGLKHVEVATLLGIGERTVEGDWAFARAWLLRQMDN